ncbi:hypothetical protein WL16_00025 [Burkholderia ubonensis]|nr:hypothetical protein WL16_00025 [Burkholderia ubonensis]
MQLRQAPSYFCIMDCSSVEIDLDTFETEVRLVIESDRRLAFQQYRRKIIYDPQRMAQGKC